MITVIGAGASGVLSAVSLGKKGLPVTLVERNEKIMKKIYATGNGRCNFTNQYVGPSKYRSGEEHFVDGILAKYPAEEIVRIFESAGIYARLMEEGKYFPMSLQARSVPLVFERELRENGVRLLLNTKVKSIEKGKEFTIHTNNGSFASKYVILAAGGRAMKKSGSDGSGYRLAEGLGHRVTDTFPGIVQLRTREKIPKKLSGAKYPGRITLTIGGETIREESSDILFTDYGLSGPGILQISSEALRADPEDVEIVLDNLPPVDEESLYNMLLAMKGMHPGRRIDDVLRGIVNNNLIDYLLFMTDNKTPVGEISDEELAKLAKKIKGLPFHITGPKSDDAGQITVGGVDTGEIDPETAASKICDNLYITGELQDVDGDCGGYNLHWAFATGLAAAEDIGDKEI